jgi:hypothetical protein
MFAKESRYYNLENGTVELKGRIVSYKKRRFLPDGKDMVLLQEITITEGDRLDRIAAKVGGDPEQYWRICDANNNIMHPLELTNEPGNTVKISRAWG